MNYSSAKLLAVVLLVLVQWDNVTVSGDERGCWEEDRNAVLQIKATLTIPIHSAEGEWKGTNCCRWERVTCDCTTGHVIKLDLSIQLDSDGDEYYFSDDELFLNATMFLPLRQLKYLFLSGHGIPGFMAGAGVETWSNLTKLEVLDLSDNQLNGSIIFPLARISSLRKLILRRNNLGYYGAPMEGVEAWSNLTKLEVLDLSDNNLNGSINFPLARISSLRKLILSYKFNGQLDYHNAPAEGLEFLSNLTKLEVLDLSGTSITSMDISSFAAIKSLRALHLDDSDMIGNISLTDFSALNLEALSLRDWGLSGSLPYLGDWSSLKALSLAENFFNGTITSIGLCKLENLEELDLSSNCFIGNLPSCMGNLSSLRLVDLSYNQFEVKFPSSIFEKLVSLRYLSLSNNTLEGILFLRSLLNHSNLEFLRLSSQASNFRVNAINLPFQLQDLELANCIVDVEPTFLYSQHKLRGLDLSNTQSKGPSPIVWLLENNTDLIYLDLHNNSFIGPLQLPFSTHEKLTILDISNNHLVGELVDIAKKIPNLTYLNLSNNCFQGPLPPMPAMICHTVDLSANNLTDDIKNIEVIFPPSIFLIYLDLSHNRLYGPLPNNFTFTRDVAILLSNNSISGEIPFSICNAYSSVLDISDNELNGMLPDCIGRADIFELYLSGNNLEGSLPLEIFSMQKIYLLDLSDNQFSGSIPHCSNNSTLRILDLSLNDLTGNFPDAMLNNSLMFLDIGQNHLSGELPLSIGNSSNLLMLQARENLFGGHIPEHICQFKYLRILDLSGNNLSGQIPSCIIDMGSVDQNISLLEFSMLFSFGLSVPNFNDANFFLHIDRYNRPSRSIADPISNTVRLEFMSKGRLDSYWGYILQNNSAIDLSANRLEGNIPNEIGQMNWLITLNLSNNHFSGVIPNSISNLQKLQTLDLSHNSLTGELPRDMTKLTYLESFSVAYNNLSSPTVDMKAQFGTFDNSSYEGNSNLCGPPLSKSCFPTLDTTPPSPNETGKDKRHEGTDFLILFSSFSLFFVISFWCFMAVLYFKRDWRYALFTLADRYGDMIYVRVVLLVRKIGAARTERDN